MSGAQKIRWTDEDLQNLESMQAAGIDARRIAKALGRSVSNVLDRIEGLRDGSSKAVLTPLASENLRAQVDRILELHAEGALSSRIARIVGKPVEKIDAYLRKAGREPNILKSYSTGRYGVDLPMPVAPVEELPPMPARVRDPEPEPVAAAEPAPEPNPAPEPLREEIPTAQPEPAQEAAAVPKILETAAAADPHPAGRTAWTEVDIDFLRTYHANGRTTNEIAGLLGRTTTAVKKAKAKYVTGKRAGAVGNVPPEVLAQVGSGPGMLADIVLPTVGLAPALDAEISVVETRIAIDQRSLELMRELRSNLARAA